MRFTEWALNQLNLIIHSFMLRLRSLNFMISIIVANRTECKCTSKQSKAIRKTIVQVGAEKKRKMISLLTGKLLKLHFEWHTEHIPDVALI
jgi:hypothetical protein